MAQEWKDFIASSPERAVRYTHTPQFFRRQYFDTEIKPKFTGDPADLSAVWDDFNRRTDAADQKILDPEMYQRAQVNRRQKPVGDAVPYSDFLASSLDGEGGFTADEYKNNAVVRGIVRGAYFEHVIQPRVPLTQDIGPIREDYNRRTNEADKDMGLIEVVGYDKQTQARKSGLPSLTPANLSEAPGDGSLLSDIARGAARTLTLGEGEVSPREGNRGVREKYMARLQAQGKPKEVIDRLMFNPANRQPARTLEEITRDNLLDRMVAGGTPAIDASRILDSPQGQKVLAESQKAALQYGAEMATAGDATWTRLWEDAQANFKRNRMDSAGNGAWTLAAMAPGDPEEQVALAKRLSAAADDYSAQLPEPLVGRGFWGQGVVDVGGMAPLMIESIAATMAGGPVAGTAVFASDQIGRHYRYAIEEAGLAPGMATRLAAISGGVLHASLEQASLSLARTPFGKSGLLAKAIDKATLKYTAAVARRPLVQGAVNFTANTAQQILQEGAQQAVEVLHNEFANYRGGKGFDLSQFKGQVMQAMQQAAAPSILVGALLGAPSGVRVAGLSNAERQIDAAEAELKAAGAEQRSAAQKKLDQWNTRASEMRQSLGWESPQVDAPQTTEGGPLDAPAAEAPQAPVNTFKIDGQDVAPGLELQGPNGRVTVMEVTPDPETTEQVVVVRTAAGEEMALDTAGLAEYKAIAKAAPKPAAAPKAEAPKQADIGGKSYAQGDVLVDKKSKRWYDVTDAFSDGERGWVIVTDRKTKERVSIAADELGGYNQRKPNPAAPDKPVPASIPVPTAEQVRDGKPLLALPPGNTVATPNFLGIDGTELKPRERVYRGTDGYKVFSVARDNRGTAIGVWIEDGNKQFALVQPGELENFTRSPKKAEQRYAALDWTDKVPTEGPIVPDGGKSVLPDAPKPTDRFTREATKGRPFVGDEPIRLRETLYRDGKPYRVFRLLDDQDGKVYAVEFEGIEKPVTRKELKQFTREKPVQQEEPPVAETQAAPEPAPVVAEVAPPEKPKPRKPKAASKPAAAPAKAPEPEAAKPEPPKAEPAAKTAGVDPLKGKDVRSPKENIVDVGNASGTLISSRPTNIPVKDLVGGVDLSQEGEQKRVNKLAAQIAGENGYIERIIVDSNNNVVEGQHRLEALRQLGVETAPVVKITLAEDLIPDTQALDEVLKAAGVPRSDSRTQIKTLLAEALMDEGGDVSALTSYDLPGNQPAWDAGVKEIQRQKAPKPAPAAEAPKVEAAAASPLVGRKWRTPFSGTIPQKVVEAEVVAVQDGYAFVKTDPNSKGAERIKLEDLDARIAKEEAATAKFEAAKPAQAEREAKAAAEEQAKADKLQQVDAFVSGAGSMQAGKQRKILTASRSFNGKSQPVHALVEERVAAGATVVPHDADKRRLQMPNGSFFTQGQTTSTGMDYAEFLIGQKPKAPEAAKSAPAFTAEENAKERALIENEMKAAKAMFALAKERGFTEDDGGERPKIRAREADKIADKYGVPGGRYHFTTGLSGGVYAVESGDMVTLFRRDKRPYNRNDVAPAPAAAEAKSAPGLDALKKDIRKSVVLGANLGPGRGGHEWAAEVVFNALRQRRIDYDADTLIRETLEAFDKAVLSGYEDDSRSGSNYFANNGEEVVVAGSQSATTKRAFEMYLREHRAELDRPHHSVTFENAKAALDAGTYETAKPLLVELGRNIVRNGFVELPAFTKEIKRQLGDTYSKLKGKLGDLWKAVQEDRGSFRMGEVLRPKVRSKARQAGRRWLVTGGAMPESFFGLDLLRKGFIAQWGKVLEMRSNAAMTVLKKEYGRLTAENMVPVNAVLAGEADPVTLPEAVRAPVMAMRDAITKLQDLLLKSGMLDEKMTAIVDASRGVYLTRTYRVFDDPKFYEETLRVIQELQGDPERLKVVQDALRFVQAAYYIPEDLSAVSWPELLRLGSKRGIAVKGRTKADVLADLEALAESKGREVSLAEAQNMLADFLAVASPVKGEVKTATAFAQGDVLGTMDLRSFMRRGNVPTELRELLGENKDPFLNFSTTGMRIAQMVANYKFLTAVAEVGKAQGVFFTKDQNRVGVPDPLQPDRITTANEAFPDTPGLAPLAGLRTNAEIKRAMMEAVTPVEMSGWVRGFLAMNALVKIGKTGYSPIATTRNFTGNTIIAMMGGHYRLGKFADAKAVAWAAFVADGSQAAEVERLTRLGIIGGSAQVGEIQAIMDEAHLRGAGNQGLYDTLWERGIEKAKAGHGKVMGFYQLMDDIWKVYAFYNERARYESVAAKKGWTAEELDYHVAAIVRDITPTYAMQPAWVKALRRWPFQGTFISFPYAMWRVMVMSGQQARKERQDPDTRAIGNWRIANLLLGISAPVMLIAANNLRLGITDEDDEWGRKFMPAWMKNGLILWIEKPHIGKDGRVRLRYVNLSFTMPTSVFLDPIMALWRGAKSGEFVEGMKQALIETLGPFTAEEILAGALMDVRDKEARSGRPIFNEQEMNDWQQVRRSAGKVVKYIAKEALAPGFISQGQELWQGYQGFVNLYGKKYSMVESAASIASGVRIENKDLKSSLMFEMGRRFSAAKDAVAIVTEEAATVKKNPTEADLRAAVQSAEKSQQYNWVRTRELVLAARGMGLPERDIREAMTASGMGKQRVADILAGRYYVWTPGSQFMSNVANRIEASEGAVSGAREIARRRLIIERIARENARMNLGILPGDVQPIWRRGE